MKAFITNFLIATIWWALFPPLTILSFIGGFCIGFVLIALFPNVFQNNRYTKRILFFIKFLGTFILHLWIANITLLITVIAKKNKDINPDIISIYLSDLNQVEIMILSYCMTLLPGTTAVDLENNSLFFHSIQAKDPETIRDNILTKLINPIKAFTR